MKKRNLTFAFLLLAVVCTAFGVSGTYARYITTDSGTGTATVAKWATTVTGWDTTTGSQILALAPISNPYVASDVIAPDTDVAGILTVDLTGTQVSTDLMVGFEEITIDNEPVWTTAIPKGDIEDHFTTKIRIYPSTATSAAIQADLLLDDEHSTALAILTDSTEKYNFALNAGKTALDTPIVQVAAAIHWVHDDETDTDLTDGMNGWDTLVGKYSTTAPIIEATINLTAQQHVLSDGAPASN